MFTSCVQRGVLVACINIEYPLSNSNWAWPNINLKDATAKTWPASRQLESCYDCPPGSCPTGSCLPVRYFDFAALRLAAVIKCCHAFRANSISYLQQQRTSGKSSLYIIAAQGIALHKHFMMGLKNKLHEPKKSEKTKIGVKVRNCYNFI